AERQEGPVCLLRSLQLGHVLPGPDQADELAAYVYLRMAVRMDVAHGAVGANDTVKKLIGPVLAHRFFAQRLQDSVTVLRMKKAEPRFKIRLIAIGIDADDPVHLLRPGDFPQPDVPLPAT